MTTFDHIAVEASVRAAILAAEVDVREKLEAETVSALDAVARYAAHLVAGGDPAQQPPVEGTQYVHPQEYLAAVYRAWDEARGSRNPFSPITSRGNWLLAEYALERVGQPLVYAEVRSYLLAQTSRSRSAWQSDDIARVLAACQGDDLVLRRTKVGGKVAYLLRERRDGETFVGKPANDYGAGPRVSLYASDVPEERWAA